MPAATDRQRLVQLLRVRHCAISLVTAEEDHALNAVVGAALDVGRPVLAWSMVLGLCNGTFEDDQHPQADTLLPAAAPRTFALGGRARVLACLDLGASRARSCCAPGARPWPPAAAAAARW